MSCRCLESSRSLLVHYQHHTGLRNIQSRKPKEPLLPSGRQDFEPRLNWNRLRKRRSTLRTICRLSSHRGVESGWVAVQRLRRVGTQRAPRSYANLSVGTAFIMTERKWPEVRTFVSHEDCCSMHTFRAYLLQFSKTRYAMESVIVASPGWVCRVCYRDCYENQSSPCLKYGIQARTVAL